MREIRRMFALVLCATLMLIGCAPATQNNTTPTIATENPSLLVEEKTSNKLEGTKPEELLQTQDTNDWLHFEGLDDAELLSYIEGNVYSELVETLDSEDYLVENIQAVYLSDEYIKELQYNSRKNMFFGYSLSEIDKLFQGQRYVFTLGEGGQTTVVSLIKLYDDSCDQILKNVAIGTGVILVCVTVSVVATPAAPAVSMIFATAATTGTTYALQSGGIAFIAAAIARGYQTQDFDEAVKAGALAGSKGFKWGAITGAVYGGLSKTFQLRGATLNGLTMNEAAQIQRESKYPLDVIKQFSNMNQYNICREAGLTSEMINKKLALIRKIDLNFVDEFGRTNLTRMKQGLAALDPMTGKAYQLHHIGQKADSTLAILTEAEHMQGGNNLIWHDVSKVSEIDRVIFREQRESFWKALAEFILKDGGKNV